MSRRVSMLLVLGVLALFPFAGKAATDPNEYVRTANYFLLSGRALENPSTIQTLSEFDLIVIPAEAQEYNRPFFSEVRRRNPDIVILAYVPSVSWNNLYWNDPLHARLRRGIREEYWLTDAAGHKKSVWPNTTALNLNSGWVDYLANFVASDVLASGLWDGIFYDEVVDTIDHIRPIDTNRDGQNDSAAQANAAWAAGNVRLYQKTRALVGSSPIIITNGSSNLNFARHNNGRMYETFPSSIDSLAYWERSMRDYLSLQHQTGYPPVIVVNVNTENTGAQTDYRRMRFGLGSALLGNGYFSYDHGTESHAQLWTYDEYDAHLGPPKAAPENVLNPHASGRITQSVWEREFEQGKVVVNATDRTRTVRLGGEFEKLHGTQDRQVNDGSFVSQVTLQPRDALVLLRPLESINDGMFQNGAFTRVFDFSGGVKRTGFFAYESAYQGGNRVVHFDIDNDGRRETVVADDTYLSIYDEHGRLHARTAPYTERYNLGINIAVGDIENDGSVEIVTGTERGGGPQIRIFNKDANLIHPGFFAYDTAFRGGVNVAIGDLNGDNINEVIAGAGVGGGPHVRVFNKDGRVINPGFFAYHPQFRGGVNVSTGDVDGDGIDDIVTGPGFGGGPHVRVFDKDGRLYRQFMALDPSRRDGLDVLATDLDGDGIAEIIGFTTDVFTLSLF